MGILLLIQFANASIGFYEIVKAGDAVAALKVLPYSILAYTPLPLHQRIPYPFINAYPSNPTYPMTSPYNESRVL